MLKSPYLACYFAFTAAVFLVLLELTSGALNSPAVDWMMLALLFGLVGISVERLRNENRLLQKQIEELKSLLPALNDETVIEG